MGLLFCVKSSGISREITSAPQREGLEESLPGRRDLAGYKDEMVAALELFGDGPPPKLCCGIGAGLAQFGMTHWRPWFPRT